MIAGAVTMLSGPDRGPVDAGPLAEPAEAALKACTQRAWPYLNCVGTAIGNPTHPPGHDRPPGPIAARSRID